MLTSPILSQEPDKQPEQVEQDTPVESSRAKRLSARNSEEVGNTTRSKRLSARLNRNSSSERTSRNSSSERSRRDSSPSVTTLKDSSKEPEQTPAPLTKDSPKGKPAANKESPAKKEADKKETAQPEKLASPKPQKKNSPKNEPDSKSTHTLIIDDVIEFEVPKKASPVKEPRPEPKKEAPTLQMPTTPVLKPHKLELTEPEPVPITDTKGSKRGHSSCDQVRIILRAKFVCNILELNPEVTLKFQLN